MKIPNSKKLYAIRFYKDIHKNNEGKLKIIWGSYDDISIDKVEKDRAKDLIRIGKSTFSSVKEFENIDSPNNILVLYSLDELDKANTIEMIECLPPDFGRFLTITMITIKEEVFLSTERYSNTIEQINNKSQGKANFYVSCFGTLGVYDICIVTISNKISDVINFVSSIQNENFTSSFSLVNYIGNDNDSVANLSADKNDNCIANIQITYDGGTNVETLVQYIEDILIDKNSDIDKKLIRNYSVLGEFDLCIHIPLFYIKTSSYNKLCNSSHMGIKQIITRFSKLIPEPENDTNHDLEQHNKIVEPKTNNISSAKHALTERLESSFQKLQNVQNDSIDFISQILYIDFKRIVSLENKEFGTIRNIDLVYQFVTIIERFNELLNTPKTSSVEHNVNETLSSLSNLFSVSLYNAGQSQGYDIAETYSYFKNAGIFHKIFMAYESFIKSILVVFYLNCSEKQSEIIPILSFDAVDVPKSYQYISNGHVTDDYDGTRIISIKLPFDAIVKMDIYLPELIHEVAHYLCPLDRSNRNKEIFKLSLIHFFANLLFDIKKNITNGLEKITIESIQHWFINWFDGNDSYQFNSIIYANEKHNFIDFNAVSISFTEQLDDILSAFCKNTHKHPNNIAVEILENCFFDAVKEWTTSYADDHCVNNLNRDNLKINIKVNGNCNSYLQDIKEMLGGIKEIFCDIIMIDALNLSEPTFYSLIVISMLNQNVDQTTNLCEIIRVGYLACYRRCLDEANEVISTPLGITEENIKEIAKTISALLHQEIDEGKVENILNGINKSIYHFKRNYWVYYNIFKKILHYYGEDRYTIDKEQLNFIKEHKHVIESFNSFSYVSDILRGIHCFEIESVPINIDLILHLQNVISLADLRDFHFECRKKTKTKNISSPFKNNPIDFIINSNYLTNIYLADKSLDQTIEIARGILTENIDEPLWYRGQQNSDWGISPAIFRRAPKDEIAKTFLKSYELFRAQACCAEEIHANIDAESDWIACMQHYFIPTHFLDWSEQPFPSLYFALENYFYPPCKYQSSFPVPQCDNDNKKNDLECSAALFVLNPHRLNMALFDEEMIPNISLPDNRNKYARLILPSKVIRDTEIAFEENNEKEYYPLAVITSQITGRIHAQKGHFTACNIKSDYSKFDDPSKIVCLYEIQKRLLNEHKIDKPFLVKIYIPYERREQLANLLKTYGINKSTYYPELMNIGTDITNSIYH